MLAKFAKAWVYVIMSPNGPVCAHHLYPSHRRLERADCPRDRADLLLQKCIIRTGLTWSAAHSRAGHTQNPAISPWPPYPPHTKTCANQQPENCLLRGTIFMLNQNNQLGAMDDVGCTFQTTSTCCHDAKYDSQKWIVVLLWCYEKLQLFVTLPLTKILRKSCGLKTECLI